MHTSKRYGHIFPELTTIELTSEIHAVLESLCERGYVRITTALNPRNSEDHPVVPKDQAEQAIRLEDSYGAPEKGGLWVAVTDEGYDAYENTTEYCQTPHEALVFVDECDARGLGIFGVTAYRAKDNLLDLPPLEYGRFSQQPKDLDWEEARGRSVKSAKLFLTSFVGRNDVVLYPEWTDANGRWGSLTDG